MHQADLVLDVHGLANSANPHRLHRLLPVVFLMHALEGNVPTAQSDSLKYSCPAHFQAGTPGL